MPNAKLVNAHLCPRFSNSNRQSPAANAYSSEQSFGSHHNKQGHTAAECSLVKEFTVVPGVLDDWRKLSVFHYRSRNAGATREIFTLRQRGILEFLAVEDYAVKYLAESLEDFFCV